MRNNRVDREFEKFEEVLGKTTVRITTAEKNFLSGISFDDILVSYPSDTIEVYSYYKESVFQRSIEVTYDTKKKKNLIRARILLGD